MISKSPGCLNRWGNVSGRTFSSLNVGIMIEIMQVPDPMSQPPCPCRLSAFSRPRSAGLFQRVIHRLVDCKEMPLSWVRINFRTEHGADLIRGHAGHTGVDPAQVGPLLSVGKGKVESVNDSDGIGLLLPFA